jgi:hypothetical protein
MKKFQNHQRPRRKYKFDIIGHKKTLKIRWDSPFNDVSLQFDIIKLLNIAPQYSYCTVKFLWNIILERRWILVKYFTLIIAVFNLTLLAFTQNAAHIRK